MRLWHHWLHLRQVAEKHMRTVIQATARAAHTRVRRAWSQWVRLKLGFRDLFSKAVMRIQSAHHARLAGGFRRMHQHAGALKMQAEYEQQIGRSTAILREERTQYRQQRQKRLVLRMVNTYTGLAWQAWMVATWLRAKDETRRERMQRKLCRMVERNRSRAWPSAARRITRLALVARHLAQLAPRAVSRCAAPG